MRVLRIVKDIIKIKDCDSEICSESQHATPQNILLTITN